MEMKMRMKRAKNKKKGIMNFHANVENSLKQIQDYGNIKNNVII